MTRAKRGKVLRKRHKKVLKAAKGYRGARARGFRLAKQSVMRSDQYAYRDRRQRKRDFRRLWITRISAAAKANGLSYSRFINGLKKAGCDLDRKQLAAIAATDSDAFRTIAEKAQAALA